MSGLEAIDEITMVCMPDLLTAYQRGAIDLDTVQSVQVAMIAHCELMGDRMAILDPPPGLNAQQIKEWRVDKASYDSKFATLYWPWVSTGDGTYLPPSGFIAGIWGRNDDTRGVHKAPANEIVRGAIKLETQITRKEHDLLNPVGYQLHSRLPRSGDKGLGCPHVVVRPGMAVRKHPPPVQLLGGVDPQRARTGRSSNRTTRRCGPSYAARSVHSSSTSGARVRCSGSHRTKPSTSSATTRPTRPRASTPARWSARSVSHR